MKIVELLTRVLCDSKPQTQADGVFLFSQTKDNQASVFKVGCDLVRSSSANVLLMMEAPALCGFPGFSAWKKELCDLGIPSHQIIGVETVEQTLNTLIEATALVQMAKKKGYQSVFVVAPPFHQLRAFMTAVTATLREYPTLHVYSKPGAALPWFETVYHSQGSSSGKRTDMIYGELDRIGRYQKKGDLATFEDVLYYLDKRSNIDG